MFLYFKKLIDKKYILVELNYMLKNLKKLITPFLTDCLFSWRRFFPLPNNFSFGFSFISFSQLFRAPFCDSAHKSPPTLPQSSK